MLFSVIFFDLNKGPKIDPIFAPKLDAFLYPIILNIKKTFL